MYNWVHVHLALSIIKQTYLIVLFNRLSNEGMQYANVYLVEGLLCEYWCTIIDVKGKASILSIYDKWKW